MAYRILGSRTEAEDALQESWLKASRADTSQVDNFGGWLRTVVARVCLDILRARKARRENLVGLDAPGPEVSGDAAHVDPEEMTVMSEAIGSALIIVMETLSPAERVAYVLHDMFDVPFDEIGPIIGRSTVAARKLASRARGRVRLAPRGTSHEGGSQRKIVAAFLAASREGNFESLLTLLSPDVELRVDSHSKSLGSAPGVRGSKAVADRFVLHGKAHQLALVDGTVGLVVLRDGVPQIAFVFTIENGKIVRIDMIADPARLKGFEIVLLES